ncbi:MAG: hypothetical protein IJ362_09295 [Oscillospiraceae bacterium]|nr:hypothetical protein [Oscillospiraceae bacterium]
MEAEWLKPPLNGCGDKRRVVSTEKLRLFLFNNSISNNILSLERELCLALSGAVKPLFMGFAVLFIFCQVVSGFVVFEKNGVEIGVVKIYITINGLWKKVLISILALLIAGLERVKLAYKDRKTI